MIGHKSSEIDGRHRELHVLDCSTQSHLLYELALNQRKVVAETDKRDVPSPRYVPSELPGGRG